MSLSLSLRHRFGDFALDVAFDAPQGVTVLFGASGAGKSSIINALAGLLRPDFGQISVDGRVLLDTARGIFVPPHRRRMAVVFQDVRLFPHLTVRQNLTYGRWFAPKGGAQPSDIVDLLDLAPLLLRQPATLSGGEAQRVALGRALLSNPHMLLMDEPLAALDTARKAEILPYIERLRDDARLPILYVTHAMAEAARLASTLVVLGGGHVLHRGPAGVLLGDNAALRDMGQGGAASHLRAIVAGHTADGLTQLATAGGDVYVPRQQLPLGAQLQLGIAAADVMLSRTRPIGLSAQNILACTIDTVQPYDDSGVLVHLVMGHFAGGQFAAGQDRLIAHITRRAALDLGLGAGQAVFAIVKTTAIARQADAP